MVFADPDSQLGQSYQAFTEEEFVSVDENDRAAMVAQMSPLSLWVQLELFPLLRKLDSKVHVSTTCVSIVAIFVVTRLLFYLVFSCAETIKNRHAEESIKAELQQNYSNIQTSGHLTFVRNYQISAL
jgi:hypothetical protein